MDGLSLIADLILGILPPLLAGPVAGWIHVWILKRGKLWHLIPLGLYLLAANTFVCYLLVIQIDAFFSLSALLNCFLSPAAAGLTLLVMRLAWRNLPAANAADKPRRGLYILGLFLIPLLQLSFVFMLQFVVGPILCRESIIHCTDW